MMNKIFILTLILFLQTFFSPKNEPIYYDKDWKVTTKNEALYYRVTPIKELGEMILIQDFYINGTPQEGILITENKDKTFLLQSFTEGKMKNQTQNVTFKNLEKEIDKLESIN